MRKITNLLIVLGVAMLLLPAFVHANEINDTAGLASGTDLTKSINRLAKTSVDEDLGSLIYRSLPDKEIQKIKDVKWKNIKWIELTKFIIKNPKGSDFIILIIFTLICFIVVVLIFKDRNLIKFLILFVFLIFFTAALFSGRPVQQAEANYIKSHISLRSVVIETTNNSSINAKVKDVVVLKDGRVAVNTEKGSVVTDFKSVKLL